jgi:SAM-dependent methyltransferase
LKIFATNFKKIAHNSRENQRARFKILLEQAVPDKNASLSLLDLGCGLGDMYGYLVENGYAGITYAGMDISPAMLEAARAN